MSLASANPPSPSPAAITAPSPPPPPPSSHPFLDPALHQPTLNSLSPSAPAGEPSSSNSPSASTSLANPLNEFAQQVLGHEEDAENLLGFGRRTHPLEEQSFGDLLQSEERREQQHEREREHDHGHDHGHGGQNEHDETNRHGHEGVDYSHQIQNVDLDVPLPGEGMEHADQVNGGLHNQGIYGGRIAKRKKMAGEEVAMIDLDGHPLEPHEYARLKRDSHKEVERRRRENINDGINEIAQLIPGGMDKQGKGMLLKRAATYIIEMSEKVAQADDEAQKKEVEKQDLEAQLAHLQSQLRDEHARSLRFETSWREAEDRAASSNFELERLKGEIEDLRAAAALSEAVMAGHEQRQEGV